MGGSRLPLRTMKGPRSEFGAFPKLRMPFSGYAE